MPLKQVYLYLILAVVVFCLGFGLTIINKRIDFSSSEELPIIIKSETTGLANIGGDYRLINQNGEVVSNKTYYGKYVLMFFGYTFCPDVCPITLSTFSKVKEILGKHSTKVKTVFVTVDPQRDTPKILKSYIGQFDNDFDGLTGNPRQIEHIKKVFRVYGARSSQKGQDKENYLVDHTSVTYLIGPDGKFISFFRYGTEAEVISKKILEIL